MKYHERARAILRSGLRAPVRLVLLAISDHWNEKTSECFPSIDTLVAETGLDERTVQRAVRDLVAFGAVTRDVELGVRTVYHLHLEALPPAEERPKKVRPPRQRVTPGPVTPPAESHPTPGSLTGDPRQRVTLTGQERSS